MTIFPTHALMLERRRLLALGGSSALLLGSSGRSLAQPQAASTTLRVALSTLRGEVMDPMQGHPDKSLKLPMYDLLVGVNAEGTALSTATGLATRWDASPDGLSWTFKLREGVPFHRGLGVVTAEDVAFSVSRILQPEATTGAVPYFKSTLDRIEAPDKGTVVMRLKKRSVDLPVMLSLLRQSEGMVLPKAHFEKVGRDEFFRNPVGSGPYEFVSRSPGAKVVFKAQPKHWSYGTPRYQTLELLQVPEDSTRVTMLRKGEANVIDVPRRLFASLKREGKFNVAARVGDSTYVIWMAGQRPGMPNGPFANEKVRTALSLAIDRTQIVKLFGGGDLARVATHIGGCGSWNDGCPKNAPDTYNPDLAKKLLAESGLAPFEIEIHLTQLYPEQKDVSEALASYWSALGLRPKIVPMDFATWRQGFAAGKQPVNSVVAHENPNSVISNSTLAAFYSRQSPIQVTSRDDLQALLDKAAAASTLDEQGATLGELGRLIFNSHIELPLVESGMVIAFDNSVVNRTLGGRQYADYGLREMLTGGRS